MASDEAIQLTNNDASFFKAYAVQKGYWTDQYIGYFSSLTSNLKGENYANEHKPPEMSRGYFARVNAMHSAVYRFLNKFKSADSSKSQCQIINVGAGYDTLYFNLIDQNNLPIKYVEIDFPRVVASKVRLIKSKKALNDKLQKLDSKLVEPAPVAAPASTETSTNSSGLFKLPSLPVGGGFSRGDMNEIKTENYCLISVDLRKTNDLDRKLNELNIDRTLPTLFVSECVLVYMSGEHSSELLKYLSKSFSQCCFVKYEQVNLNDKFGSIMIENMQQRSCKLLGVDACQSMETQKQSFTQNGFDACQVMTMSEFYNEKMNQNERHRIETIEFLDETELLFQLMDHYCVCIATNNQNLDFIFL